MGMLSGLKAKQDGENGHDEWERGGQREERLFLKVDARGFDKTGGLETKASIGAAA